MVSLKVWNDQLLEKIIEENDHSHLGKFKWLVKFRKYKNSPEEIASTQEADTVIQTAQGNHIVVDKSASSSVPAGSTILKKLSRKNKKKFFTTKNKSRGG